MSYIDSLMTTNEEIVYRTKQHWMAPLLGTLTGSILTIVGVAAIIGTIPADEGAMSDVLLWGGLLVLLVGLVLVAQALVIWWSSDYFVTNQKVMKVSGVLRKTAGGAGLEKINDVTMEQNVLGRMLDFGDLTVMTAADEANLSYTRMRKPAEFRRAMLDQKQFHEQADARFIAEAVRQGPTPRTQAPEEPATAPEPTTPAMPAMPEMPPKEPVPSDDIPELIQRLAALRDQGAITPEEYEAKKAELLGRL